MRDLFSNLEKILSRAWTMEAAGTQFLEELCGKLKQKFAPARKIVILDVETTAGDPALLRLTRAVGLCTETDAIQLFAEVDVRTVLWGLLDSADIVVLHNSTFDAEIVLGRYLSQHQVRSVLEKTYDLLDAVRIECWGFMVSLDNLCFCNSPILGKSGKSSDAVVLWNESKFEPLEHYNMLDVLTTAVLILEPFLEFCISAYDQAVCGQRHVGLGVVDTTTLRVKVYPGRFPTKLPRECPPGIRCHCEQRYLNRLIQSQEEPEEPVEEKPTRNSKKRKAFGYF